MAKVKITKPLYIRSCDRYCPFGKPTDKTFCGWYCKNANKYLKESDYPIPDWCPLEDAPEVEEQEVETLAVDKVTGTTVSYEVVIDEEPSQSQYKCPCCDKWSKFVDILGEEIPYARKLIPEVEKDMPVLLHCKLCKRIFHIVSMNSDEMVLTQVGLSEF